MSKDELWSVGGAKGGESGDSDKERATISRKHVTMPSASSSRSSFLYHLPCRIENSLHVARHISHKIAIKLNISIIETKLQLVACLGYPILIPSSASTARSPYLT